MWCDDEDKLAEDIKKSRLFYEGVQILGGSYSGGYYLGEPTGWSAHYEYVYHYRNLPSNDPQARTYNVQVTPTIVHSWGVTRVDWYQCPATFNGGYPGSGVKWPLVCFNGARGEIVWRSKQHDSCCKDGNPQSRRPATRNIAKPISNGKAARSRGLITPSTTWR